MPEQRDASLEETIRYKSKFLLQTTGKSKRIIEMNARELIQLSGKALMMKTFSEQFDYRDGMKYWEIVEKESSKRLYEIMPNSPRFYSTPNPNSILNSILDK